MKLRCLMLSAAAASLSLFAASAFAHDPSLHEKSATPAAAKAKPADCTQLADTQRYAADPADADVKALKAKCDAEKKAASKAAAAKKS